VFAFTFCYSASPVAISAVVEWSVVSGKWCSSGQCLRARSVVHCRG
jgi:hypothetical protein